MLACYWHFRSRCDDVLTVQPCNRLRERCSRRLINPVGQLGLGQHIDKIRAEGFVNLLRLQLSWDARILHLGPTYPFSSPLRARHRAPTL
jgi:hypothetical protein